MQLVRDVFIKCSSPQIMDWIEFAKESGLTMNVECNFKGLKKTGILPPISKLAISDESAIKQRSKLTFSKSRLLATYKCKMVTIKKKIQSPENKNLMTNYTNG